MKATMALYLTNYILIGLVSITALIVMIYWNRISGGSFRRFRLGSWKKYGIGRAMMGLLAIVFFITLNAAVQGLVPLPLEVKAIFYFLLYLIFIFALVKIGLTIRDANRKVDQ